ncbi:MAG: FAD:protein FMN transferase [Planctomycetota bacterium]
MALGPRHLGLTLMVLSGWATPGLAQEDASLELVERRLGVMGTDLQIGAIGADTEKLEAAVEAAIAEIRRVEDLMTDWRPSPLLELNAAAGQGPVSVDPELARLVGRAIEIGRLTEGAFDVTFASVGSLWSFKKGREKLPEAEEVALALQHVDYSALRVDLEKSTVAIPQGSRIGLGGIAKGYGVDRAMAVLLEKGVRHGIVNAGGDLKVLGKKKGQLWEIAIRHPRDRERAIAVLRVSNTCVVTSGDYERFFEVDGHRYHHIIDPRTGYPATGCMSATVVAPDAAFADALATAFCVLGPEKSLEIAAELPRVGALLVGMDGEVHASPNLQGFVKDPRHKDG